MRGETPRIHAAGAELVILGNGTPEQARWFVEDYKVATPVFTDPDLRSHDIVGARKARILELGTIRAAIRARRAGFRQTKTMGSARQLGGLFVITPDGRMPYRYLSAFAGDHPDPDAALAQLDSLQPAATTEA